MVHKINLIIDKIQNHFINDTSGHDWFHILRVYKLSQYIQSHEGGDEIVVQLGALLHDISDHKLNGGLLNDGGVVARQLLEELDFDAETIEKVVLLVDNISYKGALVQDKIISLEQQIVQDADRLDAIGAIGIARAFAYGGSKNRPMFTPDFSPEMHSSFEQYAHAESHTINHFYEKLLLLKDRMHTETAKRIAEKRHRLMEEFLDNFYNEWNTELE
ncbi:MAG: HD domain-containing protein [Crocinitomicaceae bacterium]|nr:MAG: HD domain-containing protein [Crocinitomicaceae bacterium]